METKVMTVLACVIIVVAAGGCAAYFLLNDEDSHDSDYTLLESNDKIKEKLTIKGGAQTDRMTMSDTFVVDSVSDGKVKYHIDSEMTASDYTELNGFLPTAFDFNYTDKSAVPDGVKVDDSTENRYKISGTSTSADTNTETEYDLTIEYDGTSVLSVNGDLTYKFKDVSKETIYIYTYSTVDSKLKDTQTLKEHMNKECNVSEFYSTIFDTYNPEKYGDKAVKTQEKFGNVTADVYTVNGSVDGTVGSTEYEDYKVYVYNGYVLKETGTVNGYKTESSFEIYIA